MLTEVGGLRVGHVTHAPAATGCTVVLFPEGTVASGAVGGGSPATREFALLAPTTRVQRIDAVVMSGGSAFGLAAADGVMRFCEERGMGFPTPAGPVPIVVGMSLFDLTSGDPSVRPTPADGYAACEAAVDGRFATGAVGAGTGARVGPRRDRVGGIGTATQRLGAATVSAMVAVNAAGVGAAEGPADLDAFAGAPVLGNTTLVVVATNARLAKTDCLVVAQGGHDGLARALDPPHATVDGDAVVAAATGQVDARLDAVRALAVRAVHAAVENALSAGARRSPE